MTLTDEVPGVRSGLLLYRRDYDRETRACRRGAHPSAHGCASSSTTSDGKRVDLAGSEDERSRPLPAGHRRDEVEGVFVYRDGEAHFTPVSVGIAGERHFEVLDGGRDR